MKYNIIIVLCPEKKFNGKFPEFKNGKYLGGQTRMDAAVMVCQKNKKAKIILVGGYNKDNGEENNFYKESKKTMDMKEYLISKGIDEKQIFIVNSLPCTKHNLIAIFNKYRNDLIRSKSSSIAIITNEYHLPRTLRLWKILTGRKEFKGITKFPKPIAAELIIKKKNRNIQYQEYIARLEAELKGLISLEKKEDDEEYYKEECNLKDFSRIISKDNNLLIKKENKFF